MMINFFFSDVSERLMNYIVNGSTIQAEHAATALGNMKNAGVVLADLAANMCDELLLDSSNLLATLTGLAQFALYASDLITPSIDSIIRFIESDLLKAYTNDVSIHMKILHLYTNPCSLV